MTLTELRYIVAVSARAAFRPRRPEACFVFAADPLRRGEEARAGARRPAVRARPAEVSVTASGQKIVEQAQRVLEETARIKEIAASGATRSPARCGSAPSTPSGRISCRS